MIRPLRFLCAIAGLGLAYSVIALLVGLALGGCDDSTPPRPPEAQVTLGTAALDGSGFLPLAGDVQMVPGAQGGFHVWLKYRVTGMTPGMVHAVHTARRKSDNKLILMAERTLDVTGADWETPVATPAFMCPSPIGVQVHDEAIVYRVELSDDATGMPLGSGEAEATPTCPPDQQTFCLSICSG